jgi:photoactive yellow protein
MIAEPYDIDAPGLAAAIGALTPDQLNALPFGAIRLDAAANVLFYSDVERQQSGFRKETLGRAFFLEIAPCFGQGHYKRRIEQALASGKLDITFDHTADLPNGTQDVDLHVRVVSANGGGCWILTRIED